MQMRRTYETTNKPARIAGLRQAALECEKKGFPGFAAANTELADLLQGEIDAAAKALLKRNRVDYANSDPDFTPPRVD